MKIEIFCKCNFAQRTYLLLPTFRIDRYFWIYVNKMLFNSKKSENRVQTLNWRPFTVYRILGD